jgi:hypothetical protein
MKLINESCQPERVLSKDAMRPHLANAWLDVKAKRLFATNGNAAVSVPVAVDERDRDGYLPRGVLKAMAKGAAATCRLGLAMVGDVIFKRPSVGALKPHPFSSSAVVDDIFVSRVRGQAGTVSIGVNPELLLDLARAMGSRFGVVLTVDPSKPLDPIVVTGAGGRGDEPDSVKAVLMPIRFDTPGSP